MSKHPSHSGERPSADAPPDSAEKPFDPSHFGRHQFPDGLREELINAEKPRIDPKFLQDTVPPNQKPVLTDPDPVVTTPRGGFVAAKPQAASTIDRDATTLIKVPTVKVPLQAASTSQAADSPSAPPVDTSRADPTLLLPGVRPKNDKRALVIGVVAALLVLLVVGLLIRPSGDIAPNGAMPGPKSVAAGAVTAASKAATPAAITAAAANSIAAHPVLEQPGPAQQHSSAGRPAAKRNAPAPSKPQPGSRLATDGPKTPAPASSTAPSSKPRDSLFSTVPVRPPTE